MLKTPVDTVLSFLGALLILALGMVLAAWAIVKASAAYFVG
jgi:hypothetical protein